MEEIFTTETIKLKQKYYALYTLHPPLSPPCDFTSINRCSAESKHSLCSYVAKTKKLIVFVYTGHRLVLSRDDWTSNNISNDETKWY